MDIQEALEILEAHNEWRRGKDDSLEMTNPTLLGIAIDAIIDWHKAQTKTYLN